MLTIVAAVAANGVIGKDNDLPWYLPADLKRFKAITEHHAVIMGRKTYNSIIARLGHPLPNRVSIVLTSSSLPAAPNVKTASSFTQALKLAQDEPVFAIGGAAVFAAAMPIADRMLLTEIKGEIAGDVFFPQVDSSEWIETERISHKADDKNSYDYDFVTYERNKTARTKVAAYNLAVARSETQRRQMQELGNRGVCAFCMENIATEQREPIELETNHWVVKKNDYPYKGTATHLLLIPKIHVTTFAKLTQDAQADFGATISKIEDKWQLVSYALGMRSGNMHRNGGSVAHLHAHIVVGDVDDPDHEIVRFKMSSRLTIKK